MQAHNSTITRNPDVSVSGVDDELVMLDLEQGKYFGLNSVGAEIWHYVEQPRQVNDVVAHLLQQYDIDEPTCRAETGKLLESLVSAKLVTLD